jgi:acyl-CoA synthetase (AMP-forming)/AMP-acid ligase II
MEPGGAAAEGYNGTMAQATIGALLAHAAASFPERIAVVDGERRWTYGDLARRVGARARQWRAQGIAAGDRVAILDGNSGAFLESYFAAPALGAILNPLNHRLAAPELAEVLRDSGARLLLASRALVDSVAALRAHATPLEHVLWTDQEPEAGAVELAAVAPDDVAQLYYTSGTTTCARTPPPPCASSRSAAPTAGAISRPCSTSRTPGRPSRSPRWAGPT